MDIRISPDGKSVALKTGPGITIGEWYVFHEDQGGGYSDGMLEGVADWTAHDVQPEALPAPPADDNMSDTNTEETSA